jgi:hypothetical protein
VTAPVLALIIFVATFALATLRGVHLGILILVAGVTYFFGIAQLNGTIDRVMGAALARTGGRPSAMPLLFFTICGVVSAMGSPQSGLAAGPAAMSTARRAGVDPVLMAIAINCGNSAGAFAPTSLFGIITYGIARQAGIDVTTFVLLGVAVIANIMLLAGALMLFRTSSTEPATGTTSRAGLQPRLEAALKSRPTTEAPSEAALKSRPTANGAMSVHQKATTLCLLGLVPGIIGTTLAGFEVDIGVVLISLGALLALLDPSLGARAFSRIDWSTAFVVGGIVTYVGVLQKLDAVNLLGRQAMAIGTPFVAALVICMIAALVSAFASTTGVLAALVPMAVPLAASGAVPGWALITTLGVSATIVDASPYSNTGATLIASAPEEERPRLRVMLLRWSLAMVVVGPLVLLTVLVLVFAR